MHGPVISDCCSEILRELTCFAQQVAAGVIALLFIIFTGAFPQLPDGAMRCERAPLCAGGATRHMPLTTLVLHTRIVSYFSMDRWATQAIFIQSFETSYQQPGEDPTTTDTVSVADYCTTFWCQLFGAFAEVDGVSIQEEVSPACASLRGPWSRE